MHAQIQSPSQHEKRTWINKSCRIPALRLPRSIAMCISILHTMLHVIAQAKLLHLELQRLFMLSGDRLDDLRRFGTLHTKDLVLCMTKHQHMSDCALIDVMSCHVMSCHVMSCCMTSASIHACLPLSPIVVVLRHPVHSVAYAHARLRSLAPSPEASTSNPRQRCSMDACNSNASHHSSITAASQRITQHMTHRSTAQQHIDQQDARVGLHSVRLPTLQRSSVTHTRTRTQDNINIMTRHTRQRS